LRIVIVGGGAAGDHDTQGRVHRTLDARFRLLAFLPDKNPLTLPFDPPD